MKNNLVYVWHIMDAIKKVEEYIGDYSFDEFIQDDKTMDAVIRQIEIIGEAASKCPDDFKKNHPEIPWRDMIDARNKMIHDYMSIIVKTVWGICKEDLPELIRMLEERFGSDKPEKGP